MPGRPRATPSRSYLSDYATDRRIAATSSARRAEFRRPRPTSTHLGAFLGAEHRVGLVTIHAYPLKHCVAAEDPTNAELLGPGVRQRARRAEPEFAAVAHRHGLTLRVDEMNSVSCGGWPAVTETYGPALWSLEELFELDRAGVDGVNFDTIPTTWQHLIGISQSGGHWRVSVLPEYYGLLAFAQASPAGSRLEPVGGALPAGVQADATVTAGGQVHVVLVNTSPRRGPSSSRRSPGRRARRTVSLLSAPGLCRRAASRSAGVDQLVDRRS